MNHDRRQEREVKKNHGSLNFLSLLTYYLHFESVCAITNNFCPSHKFKPEHRDLLHIFPIWAYEHHHLNKPRWVKGPRQERWLFYSGDELWNNCSIFANHLSVALSLSLSLLLALSLSHILTLTRMSNIQIVLSSSCHCHPDPKSRGKKETNRRGLSLAVSFAGTVSRSLWVAHPNSSSHPNHSGGSDLS